MKITKRQLRRIIREEKANILKETAERTARSFTLKGIEGLIRNAKRELAEIEELDAELGDLGREARAAGRERIMGQLSKYREAYALKKEKSGN